MSMYMYTHRYVCTYIHTHHLLCMGRITCVYIYTYTYAHIYTGRLLNSGRVLAAELTTNPGPRSMDVLAYNLAVDQKPMHEPWLSYGSLLWALFLVGLFGGLLFCGCMWFAQWVSLCTLGVTEVGVLTNRYGLHLL